ncbi:ATP-binding protein [Candidatus Uhrbacteria bacterium]|nr:ATP-binding protein [Candidatus Uhrbacteria bacterium]
MIKPNTVAVNYIQQQMSRGKARLLPYVFKAPSFAYPKRHLVFRIEKYVKDFLKGERDVRWVVIPGLRGVGKTTVMAQVFVGAIETKTSATAHFLYLSADDLLPRGLTLTDALDAYEYILGTPFEKLDQPTFIFIDEVQQSADWARVLKSLYDRARNIFIASTGSSAVSLQSNPDVARRAKFEKLFPLSFGEYEMIKNNVFPQAGLKDQIKTAVYGAHTADEAFQNLKNLESSVAQQWSCFERADIDDYLMNGTLPFTLKDIAPSAYDSLNILIDRIIDKDIKDLGQFDAQTLSAAKRLLFIMADSNELNINKTKDIIQLSYNTTLAVLDAFEKAELVTRIPAKGSSAAKTKNPAKYFFMSPAIRAALLGVSGIPETFLMRRGKFFEDIAVLHFYREFLSTGIGALSFDAAQGGADFIFQIADKKQIVCEVGVGRKGYDQAKKSMERFRADFGLVICDTDVMISREDNVVKVPLDFFLLM